MTEPSTRAVTQPRCIFCKRDHYVLDVPYVSRGIGRCHNCGRVPPVFATVDEYHRALWDGAW